MTPKEAQKLPRFTPNSFSIGMAPHLKDPKNYKKIQRALLDTLAGQHSHSEMAHWAVCKTCQSKAVNLKIMMKGLGFRSYGQYLYWKKTMEMILYPKRFPIRRPLIKTCRFYNLIL